MEKIVPSMKDSFAKGKKLHVDPVTEDREGGGWLWPNRFSPLTPNPPSSALKLSVLAQVVEDRPDAELGLQPMSPN
jgi:hypothetical protein